jgi:hypothetical protein
MYEPAASKAGLNPPDVMGPADDGGGDDGEL